MNADTLVSICDAIPRLSSYAFTQPLNWTIEKRQHWAVLGANGSGKSQLIEILLQRQLLVSGKVAYADNQKARDVAKYVAFTDIYKLIDVKNSYYQQRWNAGVEQTAAYVRELFDDQADMGWVETLSRVFAIDQLMDKRLNMLSSGELRKTLIILSLLSKPRLLILDNPYIGLDVRSRALLDECLEQLVQLNHVQLMLLVAQPEDVHPILTHVLPVKDKILLPVLTYQQFADNVDQLTDELFPQPDDSPELPSANGGVSAGFKCALDFNKIGVRYEARTIFKDFSWQVNKGEKWLLWGENGSGKSTLLSLVYGDNPQGYANDITLFDRRRGTGESIWDIKKRIGYISPEIALYFKRNMETVNVVASGFFDTIGFYHKCDQMHEREALRWMQVFGIEHLARQQFSQLSTGEQQLALLARLFVKQPDLLILDEPMHGLDAYNKMRVKHVIEQYCTDGKSLIYVTHYESEIPQSVITHRLTLTKYRE